MTLLNLFSLDDTDNETVVASLHNGKHIIGRGDLLHVTDKRVSRKHAVIDVSDEKVTLTSLHHNPCFFKAAKGKNLTVISENMQNDLEDGDQFALLPENYWFKVNISKEDGNDEVPDNGDHKVNEKRLHEIASNSSDSESQPKKARLILPEDTTETNETNIPSTSNTSPNNQAVPNLYQNENAQPFSVKKEDLSDVSVDKSSQEIKENSLETKEEQNQSDITKIKDEPLDIRNDGNTTLPEIKLKNEEESKVLGECKNGDQTSTNNMGASGSRPEQIRRENCWYGDKCFRKNPNHRATYSHPGDQDYNIDDNRPDCPYGSSCYRKNLDHRREYKHTARPVPRPSNAQANQGAPPMKKRRRSKQKTYLDSPQDDYDLEDPFIDDGSSDDFVPSDDYDDSDESWQEGVDSQEL